MSKEINELIIIGSGGHARVIIDAAERSGINVGGIIDLDYKGQNEKILNYSILGDLSVLDEYIPEKTCLSIALGDEQERTKYFYKLKSIGFCLPNIVHPTAIISKHVKMGMGIFVNAGVIINPQVIIDDNTIINTGSIVEHEVVIGKHCHVCPGVRIGGRVTIGDSTFVGIGSSVIDYINIGEKVIIGAGSVIIRDIESTSTVVGIPGKVKI